MPETRDDVYLNGQYLPRRDATLPVEDRGTLFGDGVYEVTRYYGGRALAMAAHLDRLRQSLRGIELEEPSDVAKLPEISDALVQRNGLSDAKVYWQVTRGAAPRDHVIPEQVHPSVLVMAYPAPALDPAAPCPSWTAVLAEDRRWSDCWIKSIMLLPNALARSAAHRADCNEAIMQRGGRVTEGSSTNVFASISGELRTHPLERCILGGITRDIVIDLACQRGIRVREEALSVDELLSADEVLLTGTTTHVAAVTHIDGRSIASGEPGEITRTLHEDYVQYVLEQCGALAG